MAHHCSRHTVGGEASAKLTLEFAKSNSKCLHESIRMNLEEEGVVDIRSHLAEEVGRSFEVCKE